LALGIISTRTLLLNVKGKNDDLKKTSGGKSTIGLCCLFLFIMYFVHDTNLDIGIGQSEENETDNEEGQTSGGKST